MAVAGAEADTDDVLVDLVDTDRYPLADPDDPARAEVVARVRAELAADGCSVLRDFVRPDRREELRRECAAVAPLGAHGGRDGQRLQHRARPGAARRPPGPHDDAPGERLRRPRPDPGRRRRSSALYTSPRFQRFVADCFGLPEVHELADPLSALCLNVAARPGAGHPWHFDTNEFTVSLLTQRPEAGGEFEYCAGIRVARRRRTSTTCAAVLDGARREPVAAAGAAPRRPAALPRPLLAAPRAPGRGPTAPGTARSSPTACAPGWSAPPSAPGSCSAAWPPRTATARSRGPGRPAAGLIAPTPRPPDPVPAPHPRTRCTPARTCPPARSATRTCCRGCRCRRSRRPARASSSGARRCSPPSSSPPPRRAGARSPRPDGPGPVLHAALQRYDATDGRAQLARRVLGGPLPRAARPDRAQRQLLLPVRRLRRRGRSPRAAGLVAGALAYKLLIDAEDAAARRAARAAAVDGAEPLPVLGLPHPRRAARHRPHARTRAEWPGPVAASATSWCSTAGNAYRLDVIGEDGRAAHRRGDRGGAARGAGRVRGVRAGRRRRRADHEGPRRVGRAAGPRLLDHDPGNARRAGRRGDARCSASAWRTRRPTGPLRGRRPAAARRQRATAGSTRHLADRLRRRHRRLQRRALPPRRHHGHRLPGHPAERARGRAARSSGAAAQGAPGWAPVEFVLDDDLRADVDGAAADFTAYAADTASQIVAVEASAPSGPRSCGMSPDAFAQMAFQLAHHRSRRAGSGATYESIATRAVPRTGAPRRCGSSPPRSSRFVEAHGRPGRRRRDPPRRRCAPRPTRTCARAASARPGRRPSSTCGSCR